MKVLIDAVGNAAGHAVMITGFVFTMMVLVEYLNVQTRGWWQVGLRHSRWWQYGVAATLGAVPGCLGTFTVVSLYSHGAVSFGALVAAMIATSGDEAFVMLALFPERALLLTVGLLALGWAVGRLTDVAFPRLAPELPAEHGFAVHDTEECVCLEPSAIIAQLRHVTFPRALLLALLTLLLVTVGGGAVGPAEGGWVRNTILGSVAFALFITLTVPDHFLEEHLWEHVLKQHAARIFLWTMGTLAVLQILLSLSDPGGWIGRNLWGVLLAAAAVGMIPESGPHLAFVTLYSEGLLPFGVLVANSIVQDGHGALPLLAVSTGAFLRLKAVNLVVGLLVGALFILLAT